MGDARCCKSCRKVVSRELDCDRFDLRKVVRSVLGLLILAKAICDLLMIPICWLMYPNLFQKYGASLVLISFSIAILDDCNMIILKATSHEGANQLPYSLIGILMVSEMILFGYVGVSLIKAENFLPIANGIMLSLVFLHILLRAGLLFAAKNCSAIRIVQERDKMLREGTNIPDDAPAAASF